MGTQFIGGYKDGAGLPRKPLMQCPHHWDSPTLRFETGSRLHALFYQNVDSAGNLGINWNLGPHVLASDHQAEGDGL
jgi:hypothetical protein